MKKTRATLAAVMLLSLTACGGTQEEAAQQENFAVVYPGENREVEIPIQLNETARIKTEENQNILMFKVTEVRRDTPCKRLTDFSGTPAEVRFDMLKLANNGIHDGAIYNPLGWTYKYTDGSTSAGTVWASLRCDTSGDTGTEEDSFEKGKVTLILPEQPGNLVYTDHRTGAHFELPMG